MTLFFITPPVGVRSRVLVMLARRSGTTVIAQRISRSLVTLSSRFDTMKIEAGDVPPLGGEYLAWA